MADASSGYSKSNVLIDKTYWVTFFHIYLLQIVFVAYAHQSLVFSLIFHFNIH